MAQIFREIYINNVWGSEDSRSGTGSDLTQTAVIREMLPGLLRELGVRSMLDIPCGDFHWMQMVDLGVDYTGADVVPDLINANAARYANDRRRFQVVDIANGDLPRVDLIFCRDLLVHFSLAEALRAIANLRRSGSTYLLTTTFPNRTVNADIETGQWRPLNLQLPPFDFPPPLRLIKEKCTEGGSDWADKSLGLWRLDDLSREVNGYSVHESTSTVLETKTVSVVIPTYNRRAFIRAAVESVLAQSYRNLEVVVVDDGSTDDTAAILAAIDDPRLHCIYQENHGRSHARNAALRLAVGDYIAFLDSDDLYLPGKLAVQVDYLEAHPNVGMVYTSSICVDEAGDPLGHIYEAAASGDIYAEIAFFLPVTVTLPTVMLRREVLDAVGLFDERMERFEDTDLWRRIAKRYCVGALAKPTCRVRTHADNHLKNQDPTKIIAAIGYYIDKVNREDRDVDPLVRGAGARRLCEYYATAMRSLETHAPFADLLMSWAWRCFNPKVSIVIPVYNGANYLDQAIRGALAQTYENTEILVINDGSTDDGATERVVRGFGDRTRYISKPNGGVATALNRGIDEMTGDYFSWLSHDDLYLPDKLTAQVNALAQMPDPQRCVLYGDYAVFTDDPETAVPIALPHVEPKDFRYFITTANVLHGCTLLVPRQAFVEHGGFDSALRTTQDYDLWFKMAETFRFVHQPQILVRARSHPDQGTLKLSELVLTECNALLRGFVEKLSEAEVRREGTVSSMEGYYRIASNLAERGFSEASAFAAEVGWQHLVQSGPDAFQSFVDQREAQVRQLAASVEQLATEVEQLATEVERQSQQREALELEVQKLRPQLEAVYGSRSWRMTVPLRHLSLLVGRIVR